MKAKAKTLHALHKRRKRTSVELLLYGLVLNIVGICLGLLRANMDKDVIQAEIDKRLYAYGLVSNATLELTEEGEVYEPSSLLLVLLSVFARVSTIIGTLNMYKGLERFLSDRKRKKLKGASERLNNAEADTDWTEALSECCQLL